MISNEFWRQCSTCKKKIGYRTKFYECSVSTCTGKRTGYVFCSIPCWETHLPGARHRDAGAVEKTSPSLQEWQKEMSEASPEASSAQSAAPANSMAPSIANTQRRIVVANAPSSGGTPSTSSSTKTSMDNEVLVVVSKMKTYVKEKADMNTANEVSETISHFVRRLCDDAIDRARAEGRKTIMARDFRLDK